MNSVKARRTADLLSICIKAGRTVKGFDTAVEALKTMLEAAKEEFRNSLNGEVYECPIDDSIPWPYPKEA